MEGLIIDADLRSRFVKHGYTEDIIKAILNFIVRRKGSDTKEYAKYLLKEEGSILGALKRAWQELKDAIMYQKDPNGEQNLRSAARFWRDKRGDCKSFSICIADLCYNLGIPFLVRFTKYKKNNDYTHVYIVAIVDGEAVIMDCVWKSFNSELKFTQKVDYQIDMRTKISELTGFEDYVGEVDTDVTHFVNGIIHEGEVIDTVSGVAIDGIDYASDVFIGSIPIHGYIAGWGRDAVKKVVNGAIKPVINWVNGSVLPSISDMFLFQWVNNPPNSEVARRKNIQRIFMTGVGNACGMGYQGLKDRMGQAILRKHGRSPESIVAEASNAIGGIGLLPLLIINPVTIRLAQTMVMKLAKFAGGKLISIGANSVSDLKLLARASNGAIDGRRKVKKWFADSETERIIVDSNGDKKLDSKYDSDGDGILDTKWDKDGDGHLDKEFRKEHKKKQEERKKEQKEKEKEKKEKEVETDTDGGGAVIIPPNGGGGGNNNNNGEPKKDNTLMYVGIGAGVILLGGIIYVATKK